MIDLRSDTVTRPTEEMRRAMAGAEVGDDVYGEDPTVNELQERVAGLCGFEAALFTPTGSMANVLALAALVGPGQEVLCESRAHILRAELGAHGALTGLTSRTWSHPGGQLDLAAIRDLYAPDMGPLFVHTAAVSVENTHNFAGGTVLPLADLEAQLVQGLANVGVVAAGTSPTEVEGLATLVESMADGDVVAFMCHAERTDRLDPNYGLPR